MAALSIYGKQEDQDGLVSLTLPNKSKSFGRSVQEKKFSIDFQDGGQKKNFSYF